MVGVSGVSDDISETLSLHWLKADNPQGKHGQTQRDCVWRTCFGQMG